MTDTRTTPAAQSSGDGIVHAEVLHYLDGLRQALDAPLERIRERGQQDEIPIVNDEVGVLLEILVRAHRPSVVVEFGTAIGYSTAWLARGLTAGARIVSFEIDADRHALAASLLADVATEGILDLQLGDALELMRGEAGPVDLAFLDATKGEYRAYLEWVLEHMPPGGIVLVDNALMGGRVAGVAGVAGGGSWTEEDADGQRAFNRAFVEDPRLQATVLPVGDGLGFAVRR